MSKQIKLFTTIVLLAALMLATAPTAKADICLVGSIVEIKASVGGKIYDTGFCYQLPENPIKTHLYVGKKRTKFQVTVQNTSITLHEAGRADRLGTLTKVNERLYKVTF